MISVLKYTVIQTLLKLRGFRFNALTLDMILTSGAISTQQSRDCSIIAIIGPNNEVSVLKNRYGNIGMYDLGYLKLIINELLLHQLG